MHCYVFFFLHFSLNGYKIIKHTKYKKTHTNRNIDMTSYIPEFNNKNNPSKLSEMDADRLRLVQQLGQSESQQTPVIAAEHPKTGGKYVIKMIDTNKCLPQQLESEINIFKTLTHRNVVRMHDVRRNKQFIYLISEQFSVIDCIQNVLFLVNCAFAYCNTKQANFKKKILKTKP